MNYGIEDIIHRFLPLMTLLKRIYRDNKANAPLPYDYQSDKEILAGEFSQIIEMKSL